MSFIDCPFTTLILNGSNESLETALNTIEIFGTYSGLKMNSTKNKLFWIGRKNIFKNGEQNVLLYYLSHFL